MKFSRGGERNEGKKKALQTALQQISCAVSWGKRHHDDFNDMIKENFWLLGDAAHAIEILGVPLTH